MTDHRDESGRLWVVVECEWRREVSAIHELRMQGFTVFWPHYLHIFTGHKATDWRIRPRPAEKRGLYQPWIFVRLNADPENDVAAIRYSDCIADVLWEPRDKHYLPEWWLPWITSNKPRLNPETRKLERPPVCLSAMSGLFEQAVVDAGSVPWTVGERVKIVGGSPFAGHIAAVERVNGEAVVIRMEQDVFGRRLPMILDATQIERC